MDILKSFIPNLVTFFLNNTHMVFLFALILGILLGGAGAYIYFSVIGKRPQQP